MRRMKQEDAGAVKPGASAIAGRQDRIVGEKIIPTVRASRTTWILCLQTVVNRDALCFSQLEHLSGVL